MDDRILEPVRIDPQAIYHDGQARLILGLSETTFCNARRSGELRFSRCGNRILYQGQWLLDWLGMTPDRGADRE